MKLKNLRKTLLLAACIATTFGIATGAFAQIESAKIQVDGLGCPFCVKGVEKHLKKVDGVDGLSTNLKKGEVTLEYAPGAQFDVPSLQKAVKRGGFTPGAVEVTARGKVRQQGNDFVFDVIGTETAFLILKAESTNEESANAGIAKEMSTKLQDAVTAGHIVEITGRVRSQKDALPGLSVEKLIKVSGEDHAGS